MRLPNQASEELTPLRVPEFWEARKQQQSEDGVEDGRKEGRHGADS
jgi:hypothetical protein